MTSRSRTGGRSGRGGKKGKKGGVLDGVDIDDDTQQFMFDIEHSAKMILKKHNKQVLQDVARAKVQTLKNKGKPKEAWPESMPSTPGSTGGDGGFGDMTLSSTGRSDSGGWGQSGFGSTGGYTETALGGSMGMGRSKSGKTLRASQPYSLEAQAAELSRTQLPPLSAPYGDPTSGAGAGMTLSQSMTLVQQATGIPHSRVSMPGGAGMPSSNGNGGSRRLARADTAPARSQARSAAKTKRRLAKLRASPLATTLGSQAAASLWKTASRTLPQASLAATAPASSSKPAGKQNHQHTHGSDHAIERRMCKACWSQPTKMVATEGGLRSQALGLAKDMEAQGPINWALDDLRTKYRDEVVRTEAWEACQDALRDAEILEREQGTVVPVVIVDPHPVHHGVTSQIDAENSLSQRRARARNAMKVFSFDVRTVWLSGEIPNEAPLTGRSGGASTVGSRMTFSDQLQGLPGRRDVAAIAAGHHQIQSVSFIRTMADAVATQLHEDVVEAAGDAALPAARRRMSAASAATMSTAASTVAPDTEPLLPGQHTIWVRWFAKGLRVTQGLGIAPDANGHGADVKGRKLFVRAYLELAVDGNEVTDAPPSNQVGAGAGAGAGADSPSKPGSASGSGSGSDSAGDMSFMAQQQAAEQAQQRQFAAPAVATNVVLVANKVGSFEEDLVRIPVADFNAQVMAQTKRLMEQATQAYAKVAQVVNQERAARAAQAAEASKYGNRAEAGFDDADKSEAQLAAEKAEATVQELQSFLASNVLDRQEPIPIRFTAGISAADPTSIELKLLPDSFKLSPPPTALLARLMKLVRYVMIAVPNPKPLRGSRARQSAAIWAQDPKDEAESFRPSDPHGYIGDVRMVNCYTNTELRLGTMEREFGWNTIANEPMSKPLWLHQHVDERAEAFNMMAGRETQQEVPNQFPGEYMQQQLKLVKEIKARQAANEDVVVSDVWGAAGPGKGMPGYQHQAYHPCLPPHQADPIPFRPLSVRICGHEEQLDQVPGLTVVGEYIASAGWFVRDPAISSSEGIIVRFIHALESPVIAERVLAIDKACIFPKKRNEVLYVDAVPSLTTPSAQSVLLSVMDSRVPFTIVMGQGAATPVIDCPPTLKGHRRAEPFVDEDTFFRRLDEHVMLVPAVELTTQSYGITAGAATLNAPDVWPQRYTWHSEARCEVVWGAQQDFRDLYYVLTKKYTQGPNDPNTFTARLLHEKIRRLEAGSLSAFLAREAEKERLAKEQAEAEALAKKVEEGHRRRRIAEAQKTNLAFQWRQKNIKRAAALRGKTATLGLTNAEWTAKRKKPGARCVARFAGWERWVIMVPAASVDDGELADGSNPSGGDVYGELWYYQPETGTSNWDPPSMWPEDEWDAEDEVVEDVLYDSDGNTVRVGYADELERGVLRSRASRRSMASSRPSSRSGMAFSSAKEDFLLTVMERAMRRWATTAAIGDRKDDEDDLPPSTAASTAANSRSGSRAGSRVGGGASIEPRSRARRRPGSAASRGSRGSRGSGSGSGGQGYGYDEDDEDLDYLTDDDDELGNQGKPSGLESRGNGLFDLRVPYEYLDADKDGVISVRDWAQVSGAKLTADAAAAIVPGSTVGRSNSLFHVLWPYIVESIERTCPKHLRSYMHEVIPQVSATLESMNIVPAPAASAPVTARSLGLHGKGTGRLVRQPSMHADRGSARAALLPVEGGGGIDEANRSLFASRGGALADNGSVAVGFMADPNDVSHQVETLMTASLRLKWFHRMQELRPGKGITYDAWVDFCAKCRPQEHWFGLDFTLPRLRPTSWEACLTNIGLAKAVGSWAKNVDPTSGDVFYRSALTGQTVWEKAREHLEAERKLRRVMVAALDAELAAEESTQRRMRRKAIKAARALAAHQARVRQEKLAGKFAREAAGETKAQPAAASTNDEGMDGDEADLVSQLANNPKLIRALAAKLGLPLDAPALSGYPDVSAGSKDATPRKRASILKKKREGSKQQRQAATASAAAAGSELAVASPVPALNFGLAGLPDGRPARRAGAGAGAGAGEHEARSRATSVSFRHDILVVDHDGVAPTTASSDEQVMAREQRRNAAVERTGNMPGVGWRQLRAPKKAANLRARAKNTQICMEMVTAVNTPNNASIIGLVDPSEVVHQDMSYAGPGARTLLVEEVTKDIEDRKLAEEREAALYGVVTRPTTAGTSVTRPQTALSTAGGAAGAAGVGAGVGAGAGLAAAAANLVGEDSGAQVLRALGDKERKLSEEEIKAELRNKSFLAVKNNKYEDLEMLLDEGVEVNSRDANGNTLLIVGAQNGLKRIVKLLLRRGAGMNEVNLRGNTALHYAYAYKFTSLGEYLLEKGADDSITNSEGLTCYEGLDADTVGAL